MKILKNYKNMPFIFAIFMLILLNLIPMPCLGAVTGYSEPVVSITSTDEPVYKVLARISKATGYQIVITKGWENKSLTAELKDLTLDNVLNRVVRLIGSPNHVILRNDIAKNIRIKIIDPSSGTSSFTNSSYAELQQKQTEAMINMTDVPPGEDHGLPENSGAELDPSEIEVIPPDNPGEKGTTLGELKDMESNQKKVDSSDMEVVPPEIP